MSGSSSTGASPSPSPSPSPSSNSDGFIPSETRPVSWSTSNTLTRTRSPARTCASRPSLILASAKALMWHNPLRPDPSRVTKTPYVCTRRTVPICTAPTSTGASFAAFDFAPPSCPSLRRVSSHRPAAASTETTTPETSAPFGNAAAGSATKASPRLHILTRASTDRDRATKQPPLFTCLTYPDTRAPGASCATDATASSTNVASSSPLFFFFLFFVASFPSASAEARTLRSTSPPSPTPTTRTSTASPIVNLRHGSGLNSSDMSVTWTRPRRRDVSWTCAPPPPGAIFVTRPAIFAPNTTSRRSSERSVTVILRRATSDDVTIMFSTRRPAANLVVRGIRSVAASSAVSTRGIRTVKPGATATASVSADTADTTPATASPGLADANAAVPATPAPPPSPAPASVAAEYAFFASAGVFLAVSSNIVPRSPAGPIDATVTVSPARTFRAGKSPSSPGSSVTCSRPRRPPGKSTMACATCASRITPSMRSPADAAEDAPFDPPVPPSAPASLRARMIRPPGDPEAALAATTSATRVVPSTTNRFLDQSSSANLSLSERVGAYPTASPCSGRVTTAYSGLTSSTIASTSAPTARADASDFAAVVDFFFDLVLRGGSAGFNPGLAATSTTPSRRLTSRTTPRRTVPSSGASPGPSAAPPGS